MCGIAGLARWNLDEVRLPLEKVSSRFENALRHRGPDGSGSWTSSDRRTLLVHTRLAILDLSSAGAQPMTSHDGRYTIVFNGEIYNHEELRRELEKDGVCFRSRSDTEVLLELFAREHEGSLDRLDGMFAFAVWDSRDEAFFCARDRLGEKPLYYVSNERVFAFASEVRALIAAGVVEGRPDWTGVTLFLRQGSIPPPHTHVEEIHFLEPGHYVLGRRGAKASASRRYWRLAFVPEREAVKDPEEALRSVESALRLSVRRRLRADVPIGAFLSGGLDSALVAAMMKQEGSVDLQTFTVTLPGQAGDEAERARTVARAIGSRHIEIPVCPNDSPEWLLDAIDAMDVPSIDGPNTWLVSRAVRAEGIKVAFSGLGGDELFFGYPSFRQVPWIHRGMRLLWGLPGSRVIGNRVASVVRVSARRGRIFDAIRSGDGFAASWLTKRGLFSETSARSLLPAKALKDGGLVDAIHRIKNLGLPEGVTSQRLVSFLETSVYLHDQLLRDADTMSMSHALELRVPLIGWPVIEVVSRLSGSVLRGGRPKALLAKLAGKVLPGIAFSGRKQGFTLNWEELLSRLEATAPLRPLHLSSAAVEDVWRAWRRREIGFAYPFALFVLERHLSSLSRS
jgi:asparagine synthase (glutamine-hydrolysing)